MSLKVKTSFKSSSSVDRFKRIITTPLGSRVVRPHFGSKLYLLIDKPMTQEWRMLFTKYTLEAFYDENHNPWDDEFIPKKVKILSVDATAGVVAASIEFEDETVEFNMGGLTK